MGNSRVSYTEGSNGNVQVVEENSYYAFGLQHKGYGPAPTGLGNAHAEEYKYNGKELQDELGLNMYDYGARNYDPAIGRWMNIDPKAETSRRWSPYTYCYNNPIRFIDPDGMQADDWVRKGNKWSYKADIKTAEQAKAAGYDGFAANGSVIHGKGNGVMGHYTLLNDGYGRQSTKEEIAAANSKDNYGTEKPTENAVRSNVLEPSVGKAAEVAGNVAATTELVRDSKVGTMLRGGQEAAESVTKGLKIGGAVVGAVSIGATLYEYQQGNISGVEATVDVIMGGVGFLGPVGAGASLLYSLGKATYEYTTGETLFEKPSQEVPTSPTQLKI